MAASTERQAAEALRQENARLSADLAEAQRDNRGYRNLLIAAAHEMRTPLNTILLSLEVIGKLSSPDQESERIVQVERAKRVLEGYVNRTSILLDAARITGGVFRLSRESVVLEQVVSAITDLYTAKAEYQGTRIDVDVLPGIVGHWDRAAVETILANLVSNALKYGDGTPVVITGTAHNASAVIRVADCGRGIPEGQHTRIFEKFNRAPSSGSNLGYGLGLWIAREFARLHGGSIILEPTNSGSTFVVTLPMGQATIAESVA